MTDQPTEAPTYNALSPQLQDHLAPMLERWAVAKREADDATERAESIAREIKDLCTQANLLSGTKLLGADGRPVAAFSVVNSWRLDTNRMKAEHPEVYAAYAKRSLATKLALVK